MTFEVCIMHAALRQNLGYRMANLLADPQLTLRAAGRGTLFLMMAGHGLKITSSCPRLGHWHCHLSC
ncbi:hypothetical protein [Bradyrhizobium sp. 4]|uniref:hypothetical protein n=1 Tax=Bradyrhizobium sp. 4 TaxID=2782678 RepID=UPI001FFE810F|nr:hypothetical protein [Bradyrhizobium sp. 4]